MRSRRVFRCRARLKAAAFAALPFAEQVQICERVERVENLEVPDDPLYTGVLEKVNARIGTTARSLVELVEQIGVARLGHRPVMSVVRVFEATGQLN